jgi:hypothetical protein
LKENVIVGKRIPAGTGAFKYETILVKSRMVKSMWSGCMMMKIDSMEHGARSKEELK